MVTFFPNFGLEMDEKPGVLGLGMVTFPPIFGLEMDEKSGVLVWKWLLICIFVLDNKQITYV